MKSVLVIGAGIGGIATAARLARHGYQVTIIEKNEQAGGRCGQLMKDGHRFDTGATLYLMPDLYAQTFTDLGENIDDHLDLRRIDPTYQINFHDGITLNLTSDLNVMQAQLESIEPGSFGGFLRYLNEGRNHYNLSLKHLVERNFRTLPEFCSPSNLLLLFRLKALVNHMEHMANFFKNPRLKIAFTFQNLYMGLNPFDAPAIYSLLQYTELSHGIWFPMGGMYSIIEALVRIARRYGVRFVYNASAKKIITTDNLATGVALADGQQIQADLVVANADLCYVYSYLLPYSSMVNRLERKKHGYSAIVFYWGVARQYHQLGAHNLFLSGDDRQSFDPIFSKNTFPENPHFYVHAPVRIDPVLAPTGHDSLIVAIPVAHINETAPQDWDTIRKHFRKVVLHRLKDVGIIDLEEHLKFEVSFTPQDWQRRYNLTNGSTQGLSHNLTQMGYLRPHNRHNTYQNLYFVGASTHPGTGLPTVLVSARLTSERIFEEIGVPLKAYYPVSAVPR